MFLTRLLILLFIFFFLLSFAPGSYAYAQETITFQIHPYLSPSELLKRFAPLVEYLKEQTNMKIVCNISKDYREHIELVGKDKVHIAYVGPASYVEITRKYGEKPILARLEINGTPMFQGVFITRKDSSITTLRDLKGKTFAFGDPESTMSHVVPLYMMNKAGISKEDLANHEFLKSHQNVALGVLMGDFDAGAVKEEIFHQYRDRGLRDVAWTPKISEHLFIAQSSLPEETVNKLRTALLNLKNESNAQSIMSSIKENMTALVSARDEDYDNLRLILTSVEKLASEE